MNVIAAQEHLSVSLRGEYFEERGESVRNVSAHQDLPVTKIYKYTLHYTFKKVQYLAQQLSTVSDMSKSDSQCVTYHQ